MRLPLLLGYSFKKMFSVDRSALIRVHSNCTDSAGIIYIMRFGFTSNTTDSSYYPDITFYRRAFYYLAAAIIYYCSDNGLRQRLDFSRVSRDSTLCVLVAKFLFINTFLTDSTSEHSNAFTKYEFLPCHRSHQC